MIKRPQPPASAAWPTGAGVIQLPSVGAAARTAATAAIPARLRPAAPSPPSGLASLASAGAGSASSGSPRPPCVRTASGSPVRCPEPGFCWFLGTRGGPLSLLPCWIQRSRGTAASRQGWRGGRSAPSCPHPGAVPAPPLLLVGPHEYTFRNESWLGACACAAPPAASSPGQAQSQRRRQGRAWRPPAWCRRVCLRRCRGHLPLPRPQA